MFDIQELYRENTRPVVTAHRGFSGLYPENTLLAFEKAYEVGADFIEFDVRETADQVPIIIHDDTLDRTTNGSGKVTDWNLADIKKLNASYWKGTHNAGERLDLPLMEESVIPTLEETLQFLDSKEIGINIQMYVSTDKVRKQVCDLYRTFDLYKRAFLMIGSFDEAEQVKAIDPNIQICVGEDRENLQRHKDFGSLFIQPHRQLVTPEFCKKIKELGLYANMFFSNEKEEQLTYLNYGLQGILTDRPDFLCEEA